MQKPIERKIKPVEGFDPRPVSFRNLAQSRLPDLLQKVKGEQLCISLSFYPQFQCGQSHKSVPAK